MRSGPRCRGPLAEGRSALRYGFGWTMPSSVSRAVFAAGATTVDTSGRAASPEALSAQAASLHAASLHAASLHAASAQAASAQAASAQAASAQAASAQA